MFNLSLEYGKYRKYAKSSSCIVCGHAYYQEILFRNNELLELISSWSTEIQFVTGIEQLNGSYLIVRNNGNQILAAVDRLRSIPIFYGQKGSDFFLSDSAEWVRNQIEDSEFDLIAKEEFLFTGYVTGSDTLYPNVKQLQAGEVLIFSNELNHVKLQKIMYFQSHHEYDNKISKLELINNYRQTLVHIFKRLIEIADGRTLIIPLSGGYDSRLIVLMLKLLKYDNVLTFSYGAFKNYESIISNKIAKKLKMHWEFIPYTHSKWFRWFNSAERKEYWKFAGNYCSVVHDQDWPAVWELKIKGLIKPDSIFVPGHSADLLAGNRSRYYMNRKLYTNKTPNRKLTLNKILRFHYCLRNLKEIDEKLRQKFEKRILLTLGDVRRFPDNASSFEYWDMVERQAKFIINSLRVYEFWGYEWQIPFWDLEYIQFWERVPLAYKVNENLHTSFIDKLYLELTGEENIELNTLKNGFIMRHLNYITLLLQRIY